DIQRVLSAGAGKAQLGAGAANIQNQMAQSGIVDETIRTSTCILTGPAMGDKPGSRSNGTNFRSQQITTERFSPQFKAVTHFPDIANAFAKVCDEVGDVQYQPSVHLIAHGVQPSGNNRGIGCHQVSGGYFNQLPGR